MRRELKKARKDIGFTVEQLSGMVNISTSFYYKIESGRRNPTMALAGEIARALHKKVELLFFSEGMDNMSKGDNVKKQLRCAVSGCFDKHNICCKACDIKGCRFKCNFIKEEICKHQYL